MREKINYITKNWSIKDKGELDLYKKQLNLKRFFDILFSVILLFLFFPLIVIITILNLPYPFYFQKRVGKNGRYFYIIKFRSMVVGAERKGWNTKENDSRLTFLGKFLRKTSLDELPQLFNILKGDMSFIGPRPDLERQIKVLKKDEAKMRLFVPQGLTGLAQVNGRSDLTYLERLYYDLFYVYNFNLLLDLKIIFQTFKQIFKFAQSK